MARVDAMLAQNIYIDSQERSGQAIVEEVAQFDRDLDRVRGAIRKEINRLTVDALQTDLQMKTRSKR